MGITRYTAPVAALVLGGFLSGMLPIGNTYGMTLSFDDLGQAYAQNEIMDLVQHAVIDGTGNSHFEPAKRVTRAEFTAMLLRLLKLNPVRNAITPFSDTPRDAWYFGTVHAALDLGIAQGTGPDAFSPDAPVTRQEAAVLLANAVKQSTGSVDAVGAYPDAAAIDAWAAPAVSAAKRLGLMEGDSAGFRPRDSMTRQEAAVVLDRLLRHPAWSDRIQAPVQETVQLGWLYNRPLQELKGSRSLGSLNTLSPSWYFLGKNGVLSDQSNASDVEWAHANGKKVWPLVGNRYDTATTHALLSDPAARQTFIKLLADAVKNKQVDGFNIDFENMDKADRGPFTVFIRELADALHTGNRVSLSVDVPPDLGTDWSEPYDFAELGKAADYLVLMGYEEHWNGDPVAGSVSSLPWLNKSISDLLGYMPAGKLVVGLPFYTRDWTTANGAVTSQDLTIQEQAGIMSGKAARLSWLPREAQYIAVYGTGSIGHRIWTEDSRSLSLKLDSAIQAKTAGAAFWYAGTETPDVWDALDNERRYASFIASGPATE